MSTEREPSKLGASLLILAVVATAAAILVATPWLIKPYSESAPWFDSAAMFPRIALGVVIFGAIGEWIQRRFSSPPQNSEEMDASSSSGHIVGLVAVLMLAHTFVVPVIGFGLSTVLFILLGGWMTGISLRFTLLFAISLAAVLWFVFERMLHVSFGSTWLWG